jgi:hypothetical protein
MWSLLRRAHLLVSKSGVGTAPSVLPSGSASPHGWVPPGAARGGPDPALPAVEFEVDDYSDILPAMLVRCADPHRPTSTVDDPRRAG